MNTELIAYYVNLLIIQYANLPRATGHIDAIIDANMIYDLVIAVGNAYDIDTAVGVQLDVLGAYIGVSRIATGTPLSDSDYRAILSVTIAKNNGNASLKSLDDIAEAAFTIPYLFFDTLDMILWYVFETADQSAVEDAIALGLLPKPAAVGLSVGFTADIDIIFGYGDYDASVAAYISSYGTYAAPGSGGWYIYG